MMNSREISNGFANRFLIIYAERTKLVALPTPTPDSVVTELAKENIAVINFAKGNYPQRKDGFEFKMTAEAQKHYAELYTDVLCARFGSELVNVLLERRAPLLLRLAVLFAVMDMTYEIEPHHLDTALHWIKYQEESIKFIFEDAVQEHASNEIQTIADTIVTYLNTNGKTQRSDLTKKAFHGRIDRNQLDTALDLLLHASPPVIKMTLGTRSSPGAKAKYYSLCESSAKSETSCQAASASLSNITENSRKVANDEQVVVVAPDDFSHFSPHEVSTKSVTTKDFEHNAHNSLADKSNECISGSDA